MNPGAEALREQMMQQMQALILADMEDFLVKATASGGPVRAAPAPTAPVSPSGNRCTCGGVLWVREALSGAFRGAGRHGGVGRDERVGARHRWRPERGVPLLLWLQILKIGARLVEGSFQYITLFNCSAKGVSSYFDRPSGGRSAGSGWSSSRRPR